jgi:hypothetical protein
MNTDTGTAGIDLRIQNTTLLVMGDIERLLCSFQPLYKDRELRQPLHYARKQPEGSELVDQARHRHCRHQVGGRCAGHAWVNGSKGKKVTNLCRWPAEQPHVCPSKAGCHCRSGPLLEAFCCDFLRHRLSDFPTSDFGGLTFERAPRLL